MARVFEKASPSGYGSPMSDTPIEGEVVALATPETAENNGFSVHLTNFDGPFDLLLQLISRHKMDVTDVALGVVTDDFIAYIRTLEGSEDGWDLDETTEFLVVAATLLDLKAARLLPSGEVEDEGDLALLEARELLFARLLVSVAEEALKIVDILRAAGRSSFRTLISDADSTLVVVARFLGLLELYREGVVRFEQVVALGELQVTWVGTATGDIQVSDEFDLPPVTDESETKEE